MPRRTLTALVLSLLVVGTAREAAAQQRPRVRNPQGTWLLSGQLGVTAGSNRATTVALGLAAGYAVVHGVVPGIRGLVSFTDPAAGEVATTLLVTPPIVFYAVPYAYAEAGVRGDGVGRAWLAGAGGGLYLGEPASRIGFTAGYVFRRYFYDTFSADGSGLSFGLQISL